jgi:hypothetical protein
MKKKQVRGFKHAFLVICAEIENTKIRLFEKLYINRMTAVIIDFNV